MQVHNPLVRIQTTANVAEARQCLEAHRRGLPCGFVVDTSSPHRCWIWQQLPPTGIGPFLAFYIATYGEPPEGFDVQHQCDGRRNGCVRPEHLVALPAGGRARRLAQPHLDPEVRDGFARRLREEREARGMKRPAFARELGISTGTLEHWEAGRVPAPDRVREAARILGWDSAPSKWVVTLVHQVVVEAPTAGDALRDVRDQLRVEGEALKTSVYSVLPAGVKRRRRRH